MTSSQRMRYAERGSVCRGRRFYVWRALGTTAKCEKLTGNVVDVVKIDLECQIFERIYGVQDCLTQEDDK